MRLYCLISIMHAQFGTPTSKKKIQNKVENSSKQMCM